MKITQDIREYAAEEEMREKGMEEKSKEFVEGGSEVYV